MVVAESPLEIEERNTVYSYKNAHKFLDMASQVPAWILGEEITVLYRKTKDSKEFQSFLFILGTIVGLMGSGIIWGLKLGSLNAIFALGFAAGGLIFGSILNFKLPEVRLHDHEAARLDDISKLVQFSDTPKLFDSSTEVLKQIFESKLRNRAEYILALEKEMRPLNGDDDASKRNKDALLAQRNVLRREFDERFWIYKSLGVITPGVKKQFFFPTESVSG